MFDLAVTLEAIKPVFNAGLIVKPGEIFSAEDGFASRLLEAGSAKVHNLKPAESLEDKLNKLNVDTLKERIKTYNEAVESGELNGEKIELASNAKKADIIAALIKVETVDKND